MKRIFAAIKVVPDKQIVELYKKARNEFVQESINWVNTENLHLTLKFFGDTPETKIESITDSLLAASKLNHSFTFTITGLGSFGSQRFPKIIWLGIENSLDIIELYNSVNDHLKPLGYLPDKPNFKPHLTIGRIKKLRQVELLHQLETKYENFVFQNVRVENFALYQSILKPTGPVYKTLETFELEI
jgi:RNA 2',3'-cyclic 3'-phosphodiesterase